MKKYWLFIVLIAIAILFSAWVVLVYVHHDTTSLTELEPEASDLQDQPGNSITTPTNWQWRGENRNGVYNETGLLKEWPSNGPRLIWKHEGLGEGHTSVALANGKIYITGMHDDDLILFVLNLDGKLLTEKKLGKEWNINWNGTRSSVCINDGKLYIFSALGILYCLDEATLREVWKKDLLTDFDGKKVTWGIAENPLIVGDKIFMTPGGIKDNMVAMNKHTGALIWSSSGIGKPSAYCSPLYISDQSIPMVVTCVGNDIMALNAETGKLLWSFPQPSDEPVIPNIPIYSNGMILTLSSYKGGAWMYRLKDGGRSADLVWKNNEVDNQMGSAIKVGDYFYTSGFFNRFWFCVEWNTGKIKYRFRNLGECNVIFADGMLYVYSDKGTMNLLKPNPDKFELVSSFQVNQGTGPHWSHPVIHNGVLYIRHGDALLAYKIK